EAFDARTPRMQSDGRIVGKEQQDVPVIGKDVSHVASNFGRIYCVNVGQHPVWGVLRQGVFLKKIVLRDAVWITLHDHGAAAEVSENRLRDSVVVRDNIGLGVTLLRP